MQTSIVAKLDGLRFFGRIHIDDSSENLRLGEGEELARFHTIEKVVPLVQQQIHAHPSLPLVECVHHLVSSVNGLFDIHVRCTICGRRHKP